MRYLALGDSISIDYYTGVEGGGAASQLALKLGALADDFQNLTRDGNVAEGVLAELERIRIRPQVVTLTAGGNDFLLDRPAGEICQTLAAIAERLSALECPVILNTVYDPTDGDDAVGVQMGLRPSRRVEYEAMNRGIREIARRHGFLFSDLEALFRGNGAASARPWLVRVIEPNLLGATAIAGHWLGLLHAHPAFSRGALAVGG